MNYRKFRLAYRNNKPDYTVLLAIFGFVLLAGVFEELLK